MYIDTRDLKEQRYDLKQEILESFLETFEHYAERTETFDDILFDEGEIESWREDWREKLDEIEEIDRVEDEVCNGEFDSGTTLIKEYDFEEYCEEFVRDCGYLSRDTPALIENNIDWSGIADDMRIDYSELEYQGTTYLFR
jgi:hypothetical protein